MSSRASSIAALVTALWLLPPYVRPACPPEVGSAEWFEWQMQSIEKKISAERRHAIEVLRNFASRFPDEPECAGVLFRLAELLWEQAQADFIARMKQYDKQLDLWRAGKLPAPPAQPSMDLSSSIAIYERLLEKFPDFEQADTVLYLYGFALNERGDEQAALSIYRTLLKKYPNSRFVPDAHMALAEYEFSKGRWKSALAHYLKVLSKNEGYLFDLALYKTAWCHFKLGQPKLAAARFRQLLERTANKKKSGIGRVESAAKQLEREAIEDLALTFSESGGARAAYEFMRQVGGPEYSKRVLSKLADVFRNQGRLEKARQTWRLLLDKFPFHPDAPIFAESIALTLWQQGSHAKALAEYEKLASMFGKDSPWAREQKSADIVQKGLEIAERSLRFAASARHREAMKSSSRKNLLAAVESYRKYLKHFGDNPHSAKISYQLGEALFELKDFKAAADAYLKAWKTLEDKKLSTEALYSAVLCFDKLRPAVPGTPPDKPGRLAKVEVAFIEHGRRFVEMEPSSSRAAKLELEIGRLFYARGHFERAAGILVGLAERLPEKPEAAEAALLACDALQKLGDFERLEKLARRLRSNKRLARGKLAGRLDGIIAAAMFKQALAMRGTGAYEQAAALLERIVEQYPRDDLAPRALLLAGASLEKAGKRKRAVALFERVWKEYPRRAADAAYVLAELYRKRYEYIEAAKTLVRYARQFPRSKRSPEALLQAATLYKAKHKWKEQVKILDEFSRRYPRHPKAAEALFEAGLALEKEGKYSRSLRLFRRYLKRFARRTGKVRQARLHLALALIGLGKYSVAKRHLARCASYPARRPPAGEELEAAARCMFEQAELIYRRYQKIKLLPPRSRLERALNKKAALLKQAESMFAKVIATGVLEWASAALYRVGEMYAAFASSIYDAPMPKGLNEEERQIYKQQLQSLAYPIEDKAIQAFEISLQTARKHGYYSRWTLKTLEQLRRLDPNRYPEPREMRPGLDWMDSYTTAPLIMKAREAEGYNVGSRARKR